MKRTLAAAVVVLIVLAAAATAAGAPAQASTVVITNSGSVSPPSCPANPCDVITRTTALQVKDGSDRNPFEIRQSGRIVSWSVTLAEPSTGQIHYFDSREGGTSRADLAILAPTAGLGYKLVALSPLVHLQPDFGTTEELVLHTPIAVAKGEVLALSVPTWLPALSLHYPASTSWRASRSSGACENVTYQSADRTIGSESNYDCLYQTAVVTFSATEDTGR